MLSLALVLPCVNIFHSSCRQLIHAGQPRLSDEQRALVWGWLLERLSTEGHVGRVVSSPVSNEGVLSLEEELSQRIVTPTVFDSLGGCILNIKTIIIRGIVSDIFLCKCKALFREDYYANSKLIYGHMIIIYTSMDLISLRIYHSSGILSKPIRQIASNVLKMVQYDMSGPPAVTLYKVLLAYLQVDSNHNSSRTKEVEK